MKKITIADVAREAGVSKGSVSYALNNRPGISEDTRARVLAVARELGWQPNPHARSLSSSRALAIGIVLARDPKLLSTDSFFASFIGGVESVLSQRGNALVLQVVPTHEDEIAGYQRLVSESRVDGVIVSDLTHNDHRIPLLTGLGLPAVTLNQPDIDSPFPAVSSDEESGIRQAVDHLVGLGHTSIAHVSGPHRMLHSARRLAAWAEALNLHSLPTTLAIESDFTAAGGAEATQALLALPEPPTAIVYANDVMAIAGMARAHALGVTVPRDLSITGYDNSSLAQYLLPPLTTVATNPYQWGYTAAETLLNSVAGVEEQVDVRLCAPELIVRGSTAPPSPR